MVPGVAKNERTRILGGAAALVMILALGCKSNGGGAGGAKPDGGAQPDGIGGVPAPEACEQSAVLYCQPSFDCEPEAAAENYSTVEGCVREDATACHTIAAEPGASPGFIESWAACNRAL